MGGRVENPGVAAGRSGAVSRPSRLLPCVMQNLQPQRMPDGPKLMSKGRRGSVSAVVRAPASLLVHLRSIRSRAKRRLRHRPRQTKARHRAMHRKPVNVAEAVAKTAKGAGCRGGHSHPVALPPVQRTGRQPGPVPQSRLCRLAGPQGRAVVRRHAMVIPGHIRADNQIVTVFPLCRKN